LGSYELHETLSSKERTLPKRVNDILSIFLHFPCDLEKIWYWIYPQQSLNVSEFRENRRSEIRTLLRGLNEFLSTLSAIYLADLGEIRHRMCVATLLGIYEFREKRCSEGRTFLRGINRIIFARVP
jgi:hypothetical protein